MTTQIDFERYTQIRDRIKAVINQLKAEGVTAAELIEACRSELQILHIEDYRASKANADKFNQPEANGTSTPSGNASL